MFHWFKRTHHEHVAPILRLIAGLVLIAILVVTSYFLISEIAFHSAITPLTSPRHFRGMLLPAAPPTVDAVASWMTFEYLNRVFKLPPDALRRELGITDVRYPRLSIRRWAVTAGLDQATALAEVKQAIRNAQAASTN